MAINLSNINISIRDFQAVSSGVINAGEVRLTSDHSIDKVNHHVGWFFSNNTTLSHAEVLAIKDAFVRALSQSGVSADAIAGIRRDLGLAPIGEKDATLVFGNLVIALWLPLRPKGVRHEKHHQHDCAHYRETKSHPCSRRIVSVRS